MARRLWIRRRQAVGRVRATRLRALGAFLRQHWMATGGLVVVAMFSPFVQDYTPYTRQWTAILAGQNPWVDLGVNNTNTYGPIHVLLALPFWVHPRLPRVLAAISFVAACGIVFTEVPSLDVRERPVLLGLTLYNPLLWISAAVIGHNDIFVTLFLVWALAAYTTMGGLAGALVAFATLLKVYPFVVVPFLAFRDRYPQRRFLLGFAGVGAVVGAATWALWSDAALIAIRYNTVRPSKFLSVFRTLRGAYSPFAEAMNGSGLDSWAMPLLLAALGVLYVIFLWRRLDNLAVAPLGLLLMFTLYPVGHVQFYTPVILTAVWAFCRMGDDIRRQVMPVFTMFVGWLAVVGITDHLLTLGEIDSPHREVVGLPTAMLSVWLIRRWGQAIGPSGKRGTTLAAGI